MIEKPLFQSSIINLKSSIWGRRAAMAEILDRPTDSEKYQPLSLLALAGFGLAVVYAFLVLIGGAVALLGRIPWLMPYWTFLLPVGILIVCWAARMRILDSEGTLSGLAFTTWGSRLAILCGITYAAYYFAAFLAVRGQAINAANDFFQKIKDERLEEAFLMSQEASTKGMDSSQMRDMLESRFNQPMGPGQPGPYTRFRHEPFVRFIEIDSGQTDIKPTGVASWEYGKSGYRVLLTYHIANPLVEFDMNVDTFGRDPKPGESKGRQWQVRLVGSETLIIRDSFRQTQQGEELEQKTKSAQKFAEDWVAKASDVNALKPAEREAFSKLIRIDDKTFWVSKQQRDDILRRVRNTFQTGAKGPSTPFILSLQQGGRPRLRENDGRTTVWIDVVLRYNEEGVNLPLYVVDGRLVVSAKSGAAADAPSAWQVDALEVESARTAPERQRMQMYEGRKGTAPAAPGAGLDNGRTSP
jgi:hypothetical protein